MGSKNREKSGTTVKVLDGPESCRAIPHPSLISTLRCIALLKIEENHSIDLAEVILKTILNYHEARGNGEDNADSVSALYELARIHRQQGRLELAQKEFKEAVERRAILLEKRHPDFLSAKFELCITNSALDHWEQVEREQLEIRDLRVAILGDDHPDTLKSLLGTLKRLSGSWQTKRSGGHTT